MGRLHQRIRQAVRSEQYVISQHANERLRERRITAWQIISGLEGGRLIEERLRAKPNPCIEVRQTLADGADVAVVWAWLPESRAAKLVTVYFFGDGL